jgi:TetR/AcrR family transcriptional regulator, cholesterol catabolism regulator
VTRRNSRDDVVRAAGRLFAERGYHGASMRDLGEALGLLGSSLYAHVGSKTELLEQIVSEGVRQCLDLAETVLAEPGGPEEHLRRLVVGHVELVAANLDTWTTYVNEYRFLPDEERARVVGLRDRYQSCYREVLDKGVAEGVFREGLDVHLVTTFVLSLLNAVPGWYRPDGGRNPAEVGEEIAELVLCGVRRG